ncbi:hypothetical protein ACFQLX_21405 [Streptomyces polyrhachis]|uniref:Uncharacterized protein n=1 Tax=Streptomyces polyrhachis TaxID=1282885 RepID=A0ABW2GM11_9ACTN
MSVTPSAAVALVRRTVLAGALSNRRIRTFAAESIAGLRNGYTRRGAAGVSVRAGQRVPDLTVPRLGGADVRLYSLMRDGRFLLLDLAEDGRRTAVTEAWGSRVSPVQIGAPVPGLRGISALLVRPDGYAAWVDGEKDPGGREERLRRALHQWCGVEGPAPRRTAAAEGAAEPFAGPVAAGVEQESTAVEQS